MQTSSKSLMRATAATRNLLKFFCQINFYQQVFVQQFTNSLSDM